VHLAERNESGGYMAVVCGPGTTAVRRKHEPASREGRLILRWRGIHRP
jgi:hypothetical protein